MGYAGGARSHPTYHDLDGHSETVEIDFDPERISYERLLEIFWRSHDPTRRAWSAQYKAAVFYHDDRQKRLAEESRDRLAETLGRTVRTEILPAGTFWRAEDYHQKYRLRNDRALMSEFRAMYPSDKDFTDSTAVARANAALSGDVPAAQLEREIGGYGLSDLGAERLRTYGRG